MALFRNKSAETLVVGYGLPSAKAVDPDETIEVPEDAAESYSLNDNFVRVDAAPTADEIVEAVEAAEVKPKRSKPTE